MPIESNKSLGRVAAILLAIGSISGIITVFADLLGISLISIPLAGFVIIMGFLSFVGFILYLIAMHGFSKDYAEHNIFEHLVTGLVLTIIVAIIGGILTGALLVFVFLSNSSGSQSNYATAFFSTVSLIWILFNVKALNLLSDKSAKPQFRIGAKVLLIAALLNLALNISFAIISTFISVPLNSIVPIPGALVQSAAWILLAKAYYSVTPPPQTILPYNFSPAPKQVKYCTYCGAQNAVQAIYCTPCGQKQ